MNIISHIHSVLILQKIIGNLKKRKKNNTHTPTQNIILGANPVVPIVGFADPSVSVKHFQKVRERSLAQALLGL